MLCNSTSIRRHNLKDAIISELTASDPSMAIDPELIDLRLQQFLPTLQTPTHPPYSSMIRQALLKLNEECGSSEEDISKYIEKEYEGLPWAHASFLSHHLEKLCGNGELVRVGNVRYMLNVDDGDSGKGDRALVQVKGSEVEAFDGWSAVKGVQGAEAENRCGIERQIVEEASGRDRACEQRVEGFEEQIEGRRELIKEVQEESQNITGQVETSHHLQIVCINTEHDMVHVDDGDLRNAEELSHGLNISNCEEKEDRALVQVKEIEIEASNGLSGVNGNQAVESENRCEDETHSTELSGQNKACNQRMEGFEEQNEGRRESLKVVQEESQNFCGQIEVSHHFEKHCEIDCVNNERYMVHVDEEMSHQLNIADRDEKEDRTLFQVKEREAEAINGWSGVNGDQAADSENRCEDKTHSMEVSGQNEAHEQRMEGFEEQNEGGRDSLKEVREESRNFSGQIKVAEEVDVAKGKLPEVARKQRGKRRKRKQRSKRQIKVLKEDIRQPMTEDEERPQKMKCASGVKKSAGEHEEQNEGRRESLREAREETPNFSGQIKVAEEVLVAKGKLTMVARKRRGQRRKQQKTKRQTKVLKDDNPEHMMEDEERRQKTKGGSGVKKSADEQEQPRRMICEQGHSQDPKIDIRTQMPVVPCDGDVKVFTTSPTKRSVRLLEKQKKEGLKHKEPRKRKLHDRERGTFIVCALPAQQSRANIDPKAHTLLLTDSTSASLESKEWGNILLRQLRRSSRRRRPADVRGNTSKRFTQSELKLNGTSKNLEELKEKQEERFSKPEKLRVYEMKTKQANSGGEEAEDSMDEEHQTKQIKVYVRRNVRKSQLKEAGSSNILSSNSE